MTKPNEGNEVSNEKFSLDIYVPGAESEQTYTIIQTLAKTYMRYSF